MRSKNSSSTSKKRDSSNSVTDLKCSFQNGIDEFELCERLKLTSSLIVEFFEGLAKNEILEIEIVDDLKFIVTDYISNLSQIANNSQLFGSNEMVLRIDNRDIDDFELSNY